jgi:hypothetical protein
MNSTMVVENIVEPKELFLMWKADSGRRHKVGILTPNQFRYLPLDSPEIVAAMEDGFEEFPAFDITKEKHDNPLPVFMRRCPPTDRRDFDAYLQAFSLDPNSAAVKKMSNFTLLGYTGAYVHGNPFHLLNPFSGIATAFEFVMQIAGAHHNYFKNHNDTNLLGQHLQAVLEPDNANDSSAVKLCLNGEPFGYIQRVLTHSFGEWIANNRLESIMLSRVNGSVDHRYAYAFVRVKAFGGS